MTHRFKSRAELEGLPNVRGTGVDPVDDRRIIVFVSKKVDESDLHPDDRIRPLITIDGKRYRTSVVEVGIPHALSVSVSERYTAPEDHRKRYHPTPGGVSIGDASGGTGTMGSPLLGLVRAGDYPVVLTNAHVTNGAERMYHPSLHDAVAVDLGDTLEESRLEEGEVHTTDSALIAVDEDGVDDYVLGVGRLSDLSEVTPGGVTVVKAGRTTGVTTGTLIARDVELNVSYGPETLRFVGVEAFDLDSGPGDSGSLIGTTTVDGELIGSSLLYAGSHEATFGIPLGAVFDEHGELSIPSSGSEGDMDEDEDDLEESDIVRLIRALRRLLEVLEEIVRVSRSSRAVE